MTVKELIEALQKLDNPNGAVYVDTSNGAHMPVALYTIAMSHDGTVTLIPD